MDRTDKKIFAIVFAVFTAILIMVASQAYCWDCIPTYCAVGADCPGDCDCFIPYGEVTGECG